jgi:hypothetical protein
MKKHERVGANLLLEGAEPVFKFCWIRNSTLRVFELQIDCFSDTAADRTLAEFIVALIRLRGIDKGLNRVG